MVWAVTFLIVTVSGVPALLTAVIATGLFGAAVSAGPAQLGLTVVKVAVGGIGVAGTGVLVGTGVWVQVGVFVGTGVLVGVLVGVAVGVGGGRIINGR